MDDITKKQIENGILTFFGGWVRCGICKHTTDMINYNEITICKNCGTTIY